MFKSLCFDCVPNNLLSCICERGTQGCAVQHIAEPTAAEKQLRSSHLTDERLQRTADATAHDDYGPISAARPAEKQLQPLCRVTSWGQTTPCAFGTQGCSVQHIDRADELVFVDFVKTVKQLREALLGVAHRTAKDGKPCWCFMWPDEDPETAIAKKGHGENCLRARRVLRPR